MMVGIIFNRKEQVNNYEDKTMKIVMYIKELSVKALFK